MMLLLLVAVVAMVSAASSPLVVKKEFVSESNGVYTVRLSYKKSASAGTIEDVKFKDSLPEFLELVSGQLSSNSLASPGTDFAHVDYGVRVVDLEFSLANRTAELILQPATFTFSKEDGSEGTARTAPLTLKVSGPVIPSGDYDQPLVVLALTIVLPLLAAFFGVQFFHQRALAAGVTGSKKKRA